MTDTKQIKAELQRRLEPTHRYDHETNALIERDLGGAFLKHVPHVQCADGFKMSVQASAFHYCAPRDSTGPWSAVEVGFPTERVESFMPYIDGTESDPTDTVYGHVPLDIVVNAIAEHGGFKGDDK